MPGKAVVVSRLNENIPPPQMVDALATLSRISRRSPPNLNECFPLAHDSIGCALIMLLTLYRWLRVPKSGAYCSRLSRGGMGSGRAAEKDAGKPMVVASKPYTWRRNAASV